MKYKFKKRYKNTALLFLSGAVLLTSSCTKNFQELNTNPNALSNAQTISILGSAIGPMEQNIYSNYQTAQNLSADAYAGYMMSPTPFNGGLNNLDYFMISGWNQNGFDDPYKLIMAPVSKMAAAGVRTKAPEIWAVALLIQVEAMDRVTDRFGPVPYTKAGTSLKSIPYDSQETIYETFFKQIDTAVANLRTYITANPGKTSLGAGDLIYNGNYVEWLKFANSLRLRLAMRIVKVDPQLAQQQGEEALSAPGGLLTMPSDDAAFTQAGGRSNDVWTVTASYGDNRLNAALGTYMTGYNDPRLPVYCTPASDPAVAGQYEGIRIGSITSKNNKSDYENYGSFNTANTFSQTAPQLLMTAAEVWFLKAEAALRGWAGAGDAEADYETGIRTSFAQWSITDPTIINNYINSTSTPTAYVDPKDATNNSPALTNITVKWNPLATNERKLERVITQKWLAIFPDGQEAWADYRRTGYPKLFPVVNNFSAGTISTQIQVRRLPYPSDEYNNNTAAVNDAVKNLLGGPDNGGTRLWWDVDRGNF